jgi:hypothetical protein
MELYRKHYECSRYISEQANTCSYVAIMNKYSEAASVVQQVKGYTVFSDIENFVRCTPAKLGESSEWTSIVRGTE